MTILAHVGPVPVEELLPGAMVALAVGISQVRTIARTRARNKALVASADREDRPVADR